MPLFIILIQLLALSTWATIMIHTVCLVFVSTLVLVLGIVLNSVILIYLHNKPLLQKTSLDLVLMETLVTEMFCLVNVYNGFVFGLVLTDISYSFLIAMTTLAEFSNAVFGASIMTLMLTKIMFLKFPSGMLERSDRKVQRDVMIGRIMLLIIFIILNSISSIHFEPVYFQMIQPSSQFQW